MQGRLRLSLWLLKSRANRINRQVSPDTAGVLRPSSAVASGPRPGPSLTFLSPVGDLASENSFSKGPV